VVLDRESHGDCDLRKKVVLITLFSLIIIGRHIKRFMIHRILSNQILEKSPQKQKLDFLELC
jgi:hypothetical protein